MLSTPEKPVKIALLGATGSIGTQVLDVVRRFPEHFEITALAAGRNVDRLNTQIAEFAPKAVCVAEGSKKPDFSGEVLSGPEGLEALATRDDIDVVIVGLVGMIGLAPTLAALKTGKRVLTANKETFVAGGHLVQPYLDNIIPIDSEHSAIFQCLQGQNGAVSEASKRRSASEVEKIYLTASGGPFRTLPKTQFEKITKAQALKHPNWEMGDKITIDSATMMNKGLEVIEAHWLFGVRYEQIQILVHPQSVVHSAVEFIDHSVIAQLGAPDMHVPIQYAMFYPQRAVSDYPNSRLNLLEQSELNCEAPDLEKFPCIALAYQAGEKGQSAATVLNAADEAAVELFLQERIGFTEIPKLLERVLGGYHSVCQSPTPCYEEILALDSWARRTVHEIAGSAVSP